MISIVFKRLVKWLKIRCHNVEKKCKNFGEWTRNWCAEGKRYEFLDLKIGGSGIDEYRVDARDGLVFLVLLGLELF